jgi:hypothetical protein
MPENAAQCETMKYSDPGFANRLAGFQKSEKPGYSQISHKPTVSGMVISLCNVEPS